MTTQKSIYQNAKQVLKNEAKELKRLYNDKPYIREALNNQCDEMCRQFNWHAMKGTISEKKASQYSYWLASFTADLHPKN